MTPLRTRPQSNKRTGLPVGVSRTWRTYPRGERPPYLEFQVLWHDGSRPRIKHFYVGAYPTRRRLREVREEAIEFRRAYEERRAVPIPHSSAA